MNDTDTPSSVPATVSVMLVDDEPSVLRALERAFLRAKGQVGAYDLRVETFTSPEAALARIRERADFDVIVSDQRMPVMDGTTFLVACRQLMPRAVRVMLSGSADLADLNDAVSQGCVWRFISKPWDNDVLVRTVVEAFEYRAGKGGRARG